MILPGFPLDPLQDCVVVIVFDVVQCFVCSALPDDSGNLIPTNEPTSCLPTSICSICVLVC